MHGEPLTVSKTQVLAAKLSQTLFFEKKEDMFSVIELLEVPATTLVIVDLATV